MPLPDPEELRRRNPHRAEKREVQPGIDRSYTWKERRQLKREKRQQIAAGKAARAAELEKSIEQEIDRHVGPGIAEANDRGERSAVFHYSVVHTGIASWYDDIDVARGVTDRLNEYGYQASFESWEGTEYELDKSSARIAVHW